MAFFLEKKGAYSFDNTDYFYLLKVENKNEKKVVVGLFTILVAKYYNK